ncbi:hypothetical protein [Absidia glauca]|uniref:U6 small nuclear RNA (adenine-(43)-N(6))-methyltransferase n=1 Tax=Absidia glauca TaxID=4829 RepID=A0A168LLK8_ABSGL|nr:hypothetical protein [Absidia glauca]
MGKRQRFDNDGNGVEESTDPINSTLNDMHPRNMYKDNPPNFNDLARLYPSFRPFVHGSDDDRPFIDFKNAEAVRELTYCLLKRDFNLTVTFPLDRLCPPIPNRLNYILWIEDLLTETQGQDAKDKQIVGIDIGVGASCIYPLLGCRTNPQWHFIGSELDEESLEVAKANVEQNGLEDRITLFLNKDPLRIFMLDPSIKTYDFCMCNPPFYASEEEVQEGLENKELEPMAACTGTASEMITKDGEYGFIQRMILESLRYKQRIQWYTSMIGLKRTIRPVTQLLKQQGITNYVVTEFCQGRTKRWGIAWSFSSTRVVKSNSLEFYRPKSHFTTELPIPVSQAKIHLHTILADLDISLPDNSSDDDVIQLSPTQNTWSRAARRLRKRQKQDETGTDQQPLPHDLVLTLECALVSSSSTSCTLQTSWLHGDDRSVFESFWNHVKKRMEQEAGIFTGSAFQK